MNNLRYVPTVLLAAGLGLLLCLLVLAGAYKHLSAMKRSLFQLSEEAIDWLYAITTLVIMALIGIMLAW